MSSRLCWVSAATVTMLVVFLLVKDISYSSPADRSGTRAVHSLQFVAVFSRHGNRSPVFSYPTSDYHMDDTKFWPHGPGQLTKIGRVQMYKLGQKFRSLYNGFLSELYHPGDVAAYSTHFDRCFNSMQLLLAGLFPPQGFEVWNSDLLWQPIPVKYTDRDHVKLIVSESMCPKFDKERLGSLESLKRDFGTNVTQLLNYASPYTGTDMDSTLNTSLMSLWLDTYTLWESLSNPEMEGLQLPSWTSRIYPKPFSSLIVEMFKAVTSGSDTMLRLLSGQIFQEMVGLMKARLNNDTGLAKQLYLYNGHDFSIVGLQGILGLTNTCRWIVETGSALVLEMHKDFTTGRYFVKVLYIDGLSEDLEPEEVDIPGCRSPCDFNQMLNLTEKYYDIADWGKECNS